MIFFRCAGGGGGRGWSDFAFWGLGDLFIKIWPAAMQEEEEGEEKKCDCEHTEEFNPPFSLATSKEPPHSPPLSPPPLAKEKKPPNHTQPSKTNTLLLPFYFYRWYRPRATKKMTVELSRASGPFIWPAEPTDFSAWSKNVYDTSAREKKAEEKRMSPDAATLEKEDGGVLRTQAERLLKGEERWRGKWLVP